MSRSTRLYQQPRSPLIQGQSRTDRPFWQPWLAGMVGLALWIAATVYLSSLAGSSDDGSVWQHAAQAWSADVPWLLLGGAAGSALGTLFARAWGIRARWLLAIAGAVGGGYVVSWIAWAVSAAVSS